MENIKNLKLIMWDLDGTILDSRDSHFNAVQRVFDNHGLKFPMNGSENFFGQTTGHIFNQVLGNSFGAEDINEMLREKEVIFQELISTDAQLLPGVGQWLDEIHQMKISQVIVSSTASESILATIKALDVVRYFLKIFSGEHLPSKPDPAVFSLALKDMGVSAHECLVFEDSPHGIQAAKSLGIKCIAAAITFPWGELSAADLVLENLEQLRLAHIRELFPD